MAVDAAIARLVTALQRGVAYAGLLVTKQPLRIKQVGATARARARARARNRARARARARLLSTKQPLRIKQVLRQVYPVAPEQARYRRDIGEM